MKSTTVNDNITKEFNLELENSYLKNEIKNLKSELLKKQLIIDNIQKDISGSQQQNYHNNQELKCNNQELDKDKNILEKQIDILNNSITSLSLSNSELSKQLEKYECIVCMDNKKEIILEPCGHLVYCYVCCSNYYNNCYDKMKKLECPMCRIEVNGIIKIYN
jgi:hypothetical protein